jgi:hypothetical protein
MKAKAAEGSAPPRVPKMVVQPRRDAGVVLSIWQVVALALFLRTLLPTVAYLYARDVAIFDSKPSYEVPAKELISHHRFFSNGSPEIVRTPGYPLLLTAGLMLHRLELVTILLQIVLSCFTVYMVYRTAQLLFKRGEPSIIAAALYAIEPLSILYTSQLLTETLFAALVTVWLYFLARYFNRHLLRDLVISGVSLAASVYVRPIGYFLPVIIAAEVLTWARMNGGPDARRLCVHVAVFMIVSAGLIFLWQLRNWRETGYSGFSGIASINMYFFQAASVLAAQQHVPFLEMQRRLGFKDDPVYYERHPEQRTWTLGQRLNYMKSEAAHILLSNPWIYARIHFEGIIRTIFDPGATGYLIFFKLYPHGGGGGLFEAMRNAGIWQATWELAAKKPFVFWTNVLLLPLELLYLLCACVALSSRRLMRDPTIIVAVSAVIYYLVISGGPTAHSRFRHPAMPIICVLAGYGLCLLLDADCIRSASRGKSFSYQRMAPGYGEKR